MEKIRWGILGCGKIAHKFAADLRLVEDATLVAVASREKKRAEDFAKQHNAQLALTSYEALASCDQVDVIYVATPHGFHYEHTLLCLNHKKAVLCEKAFALNERQANEMVNAAKRNNVFLMEAFWTKFIPQYITLVQLIQSGEIGELKMIQADFGFRAAEPKPQRLYDPELGGGALLDIGIYPVFLAVSLLGRPVDVMAAITPYSTGVDEQIAMTLRFKDGSLAMLGASFAADTPVEATVIGTKGYIRMRDRFYNPISTMELVKDNGTPKPIEVHKETGFGYQFQARHVSECLRNKLIESPVMSYDDSLLLMNTLDRIRATCGIRYRVDA